MGYSYSTKAGFSLDALFGDLYRTRRGLMTMFGNSSNTWTAADGTNYFYEPSRREHSDGAITGSVWMMLPNNRGRKIGTFKIDGDGKIERFAKIPAKTLREAETLGAAAFNAMMERMGSSRRW